MGHRRFTEEQVIALLKRHEQGIPVAHLAREVNVAENTIYRWMAKYGGMEVSDARRLRVLEDENRRLKQLVAELTLDNQALKALQSKNWPRPK